MFNCRKLTREVEVRLGNVVVDPGNVEGRTIKVKSQDKKVEQSKQNFQLKIVSVTKENEILDIMWSK